MIHESSASAEATEARELDEELLPYFSLGLTGALI